MDILFQSQMVSRLFIVLHSIGIFQLISFNRCLVSWSQVISNKWSSTSREQIKWSFHHQQELKFIKGMTKQWLRGRDPHLSVSRSQGPLYMWYLSCGISIYKWCHSNIWWCPSKWRFKSQPSTPSAALCINKLMHAFYGHWWQRGRNCGQRYERWEGFEHGGHGQGSKLASWEGSKGLDKRCTQVGGASSWTIDWLHLICAYSCACLHCISLIFDMHACVLYASYRT